MHLVDSTWGRGIWKTLLIWRYFPKWIFLISRCRCLWNYQFYLRDFNWVIHEYVQQHFLEKNQDIPKHLEILAAQWSRWFSYFNLVSIQIQVTSSIRRIRICLDRIIPSSFSLHSFPTLTYLLFILYPSSWSLCLSYYRRFSICTTLSIMKNACLRKMEWEKIGIKVRRESLLEDCCQNSTQSYSAVTNNESDCIVLKKARWKCVAYLKPSGKFYL